MYIATSGLHLAASRATAFIYRKIMRPALAKALVTSAVLLAAGCRNGSAPTGMLKVGGLVWA